MTFSKHIKLIESIRDGDTCAEIADKIASGEHEGFNPYWKLVADSRILSDHDALGHIATLVSDGYTSGAHPTWELKMVDGSENAVTDQPVDEDVIDMRHDHMVVPVAETHGPGQGWFEVSDEHATEFAIEDANGDLMSSWSTRAEAEEEASHMNQALSSPHGDIAIGTHIVPEMELVEDDEEPAVMPKKTNRFDKAPSYQVIINVIHERGPRQQEALEELHARGLWLTDEQYAQAGLYKDQKTI